MLAEGPSVRSETEPGLIGCIQATVAIKTEHPSFLFLDQISQPTADGTPGDVYVEAIEHSPNGVNHVLFEYQGPDALDQAFQEFNVRYAKAQLFARRQGIPQYNPHKPQEEYVVTKFIQDGEADPQSDICSNATTIDMGDDTLRFTRILELKHATFETPGLFVVGISRFRKNGAVYVPEIGSFQYKVVEATKGEAYCTLGQQTMTQPS